MRARDNPFSTDRVLRIRYRLLDESWEALLDRLAGMRYRAAIVGLKGTGKTTWLEDLAPRLEERGFVPKPLRLDEAYPRFPAGFEREFFARVGPCNIVLLDGAEQMSRWGWWWFRRRSVKAGGLVITSHRAGLLPTLFETRSTPGLLAEIVGELLGVEEAARLRDRIPSLFAKHQSNMRNALRELYDHYAERA